MTEYIQTGDPAVIEKREWTLDEVVGLVKKSLVECGKSEDDMYVVDTKNGWHVVTSPFNLQKAYSECSLLFEGEHKINTDIAWTGPGEFEYRSGRIIGWLHKDGMSLLYFKSED